MVDLDVGDGLGLGLASGGVGGEDLVAGLKAGDGRGLAVGEEDSAAGAEAAAGSCFGVAGNLCRRGSRFCCGGSSAGGDVRQFGEGAEAGAQQDREGADGALLDFLGVVPARYSSLLHAPSLNINGLQPGCSASPRPVWV
jgi:hypothetical protein